MMPLGAGCLSGSEGDVGVNFPIVPWHLWGTSVSATVVSGAVGPANATVQPAQLARVSYKRPETWRFLLFGRLIGGDVGAVATTSIHALFDIAIGVGRSTFNSEKPILGVPVNFNSFGQLRWNVAPGTVPGQQNFNIKWLSQVPGPTYDDSLVAPAGVLLTDHIVAQDIQCRARIVMSSGDPGIRVQVEVGAMFAPNVHVRPDWWDHEAMGAGGTRAPYRGASGTGSFRCRSRYGYASRTTTERPRNSTSAKGPWCESPKR